MSRNSEISRILPETEGEWAQVDVNDESLIVAQLLMAVHQAAGASELFTGDAPDPK